jgi:hypothetical protein
MGSPVGTYDESEVSGLAPGDREALKRAAIRELRGSKEIRDIIERHPTLLTRDRKINKLLRKKLDPHLARLKKKSRKTKR